MILKVIGVRSIFRLVLCWFDHALAAFKGGKTMKKRMLSILLCLSMVFGLLSVTAGAADTSMKYVALGDSITTGYRLAEDESSFADLVAGEYALELNDTLAQDGETTSSLQAKLATDDVKAAVSQADVITLTIGGNDLMNALYAYLASSSGIDGLTAEDVKEILADPEDENYQKLLTVATENLADFLTSPEAITAFGTFTTNYGTILGTLKALAPNASIVVVNQYNPYSYMCRYLPENPLTAKYKAIATIFDTGVKQLNQIISAAAAQTGCTVADAYTAIENATENPCNASYTLQIPISIDFDFHPNAHGHSLIAGAIDDVLVLPEEPDDSCDGGEACPSYAYGDVNKEAWYHEYVDYVIENGIMVGVSTDPYLFMPDANLSRAQALQTLYQMEGEPETSYVPNYSDVAADQWFYDAIAWGTENGIVNGRDTGAFDPDGNISREELVTMLYRYVKEYKILSVETEGGIPETFTDADQVGSYAVDAFAWAIDRGIVNGITDTTLEPRTLSRRCEMAKLIATLCAVYPEIP